MTNVTSGLARQSINVDQPPNDMHMRHVLRNLGRFIPSSAPLSAPTILDRERPTSYRIQFQPRKPRSIAQRVIDYITGS